MVEREMFSHYHALYPFGLLSVVGRAVKPVDVLLSKKLERFYGCRVSRWFTANLPCQAAQAGVAA